MRAIILAGGLGTRLRPLTDSTPKPLLLVNEKPIMQYAIENLKKHGITDITLGISFFAEKIQNYFDDGSEFEVNLTYSIEREPLGTGGAIKKAAKDFKEPFVVMWGDNISDIDISAMMKSHKSHDAEVTMALTEREDVQYFGVACYDGNRITGFKEKPKEKKPCSKYINAGVFVFSPSALEILPEGKSSIEKDCFEKIVSEDKLYAYFHKGYWYPIDSIEKLEEAKKGLE